MSVVGASQGCSRSAALAFLLLNVVACGGADEALDAPSGAALSEHATPNAQEQASESPPAEGEPSAAEPTAENEPSAEQRSQELALALQSARAQWANQGMVDYNVKTRRFCFCAPRAEDNVLVTVRDGQVVGALGQDESGAYEIPIEDTSMEDWYTVDGMFDRIEANLTSADRIDVKFDAQRGFPSELAFDYIIVSAEEGEYFEMWDFEPLPDDALALQLQTH
jgi:hypothetical protein